MAYKGKFKPVNPEKYRGDPLHVCQICFKNCKHIRKHLSKTHKNEISDIEYYNKFIQSNCKNTCLDCGVKVKLISMEHGYREYCENCSRSNGAKRRFKLLKEDTEKYDSYRQKISFNQIQKWNERKEDGSDKILRKRIGDTIRNNNENLTPEERKNKFGWQNKLTYEEMEHFKSNRMVTPNESFWKNDNIPLDRKEKAIKTRQKTMREKSPEEKKRILKKQLSTRYNLVKEDAYKLCKDEPNRKLYYEIVWKITEISYNYNKSKIDPEFKRGKEFALDHNYSIFMGYINNIDPWIIGHPENLQILKNEENLKKSATCWIVLDDLIENIKIYDSNNKNTWYSEALNGI